MSREWTIGWNSVNWGAMDENEQQPIVAQFAIAERLEALVEAVERTATPIEVARQVMNEPYPVEPKFPKSAPPWSPVPAPRPALTEEEQDTFYAARGTDETICHEQHALCDIIARLLKETP